MEPHPQEIANEAIALRRKVIFWRRAVWLVLGTAAVFVVVVWNRYETRRRECRETLIAYGEMAKGFDLAHEHASILEQQWQEFEQPPNGQSPRHYDLIVRNWPIIAKEGERVPLAVCADPHLDMFTRGRYVLYSTADGYKVHWLPEEEARPIIEKARADNPHK